ncbi:hypothetical protein GLOIN_2v1884984 [Rhizophagus irregularis DAOM 181602=DAOM 197198]|nr:hypothetical protein GLOIN_2v1884984 [Rhizophagus irregularis DAOM 181602=DAOM 197198]
MNGKEISNYPENSNIVWKDNKCTFYYKVIRAGIYPKDILCYTKKPTSYSIPHGYVIQTTWNRNTCTVQCSINYVNDKPTYVVKFGNNFSNQVVSSKSPSDATTLFHNPLKTAFITMNKCKKYDVSLIKVGKLDEELHFGAFGRFWWKSRDNILYPIRLEMKTLVTLNKTHFIITVVKGTSVAAFQPGYICEANGITSSVYDTPSGAINFLYHILFSSKTRFSGPLICGFNDKEINKRILDDIPFQPFTIMVGNLQIFIGMIGVSDQENLGYVGPGYLSSFIYRVGEEKIRTLFVQQIHQRHCSVALYQDERIKLKYSGKNPVEVWKEVWKKIEVLQNWDGKTLFGINHEKTQNLVNILRTPSCTINEWNNEIMMTQLYKQHLYKFTPASIPWYEFLLNWKEYKCNIIELYSALENIYPEEYQFKEREFRAWKALLRSVGCTNITPFDKDKSDKEFWTKAENPIDDKHVLIYLYENNFLDMSLPDDNPNPIVNKFWSCFNESLKVNKKGIDGKRRILSIIADDFSYEEIRTNLLVAPTTIFDARKYARLNGPGAKQIEKPIRTVAKLSQEKLEQFSIFFEDKANVIMSSYKSDAKTQLPVLYLKNTKKALWEKFQETYPNGLKRTTFYCQLEGNRYQYREDMGGLCAICNTYGYEVFGYLKNLIQKEVSLMEIQNNFIQRAENLQRYLKKSYEQKFTISENELFTFFNDLKKIIGLDSLDDLKIYEEKLIYYLSHQTRKVYLNSQFNATILELDEKGAIFLVDYKMKILPQTARETKQDFYGKKGWSLHSVLVYTKSSNSQIHIEAFDHWSCDAKQDAWFTASSLHGVIEVLDKKPEWISIISDNGPHYHNSELMIILSYWKEWYDIKVNKWVFLEAGEAKTSIDSHHAQISQSIKRRVKLGFEIRNGENIQEAIEDIAGIRVAHLEPDRDNENKENKVKTIPGISNYFEWRWPEEEGLDGCIQARALPHIGEWKTFTPNQISNWAKAGMHMPQPQISLHTTSKSSWKIPMPHSSNIGVKRLKVKQLQEELENRGIMTNEKENRAGMIEILENEIAKEMQTKKIGNITNTSYDSNVSAFPLLCGWALKHNQKYGKKGSGKRIAPQVIALLERFFLDGNVHKNRRMNGYNMRDKLVEKQENGELARDIEIPEVTSINNWIARFAAKSKKDLSEQAIAGF